VNPIESETLVPDLSIHKGVVSHPVTDTDLTFPYNDPQSLNTRALVEASKQNDTNKMKKLRRAMARTTAGNSWS